MNSSFNHVTLLSTWMRSAWSELRTSDFAKRMAHAAFWTILGTGLARAFTIVGSILLARILGVESYGQLALLRSTLETCGLLAGVGLGLTATKYLAELRLADPVRAGRILALTKYITYVTGGVVAVSVFLLTPWIAKHTFHSAEIEPALRVGSLLIFLLALNGAFSGVLAGLQAFQTTARISIVTGILSLPILAVGAYYWGVLGAVAALMLNGIVLLALNYQAILHTSAASKIPHEYVNIVSELAVLWKFSLPAALSGMMHAVANWICAALLVSGAGGYAEVAVFEAANQWRLAILFLPMMVCNALLPVLSGTDKNSNIAELRALLWSGIRLATVTTTLCSLIISMLSPLVMAIYGTRFSGGASVLALLSIASVLAAVGAVIGQIITSQGRMWHNFVANAIWSGVLVTVTYALVGSGFGAIGLALATLISYILHIAIQYLFVATILRHAS